MNNSNNRNTVFLKRVISFAMCIVLAAATLVYSKPLPIAHAATQQELEQEVDRLDSEIAAKKKLLDELAKKKDSQQKYMETLKGQIADIEKKVDALQTQINTIDNEIDGYNKQIKQLDGEISVIKGEINAAQKQIDTTKKSISDSEDLLSKKLRASYINGKDSTLKILMGSDSLASFLTGLEIMKRMSEDDKRVINDFKKKVETLAAAKKELETKQTVLVEKQTEVEETKAKSVEKKKELSAKQNQYDLSVNELEKDYSTAETYMANIDKNSAYYKSYITQLQKEREEADKEIENIIASYQATTQASVEGGTLPAQNGDPGKTNNQNSSGGSPAAPYASSGTWGWPLGTASCYISSGYGYRNPSISGWGFHGGIDITGGVYGKPIYASRAGTVIAAVWSNKGYGNYVILDHGDGFISLYGHCSSLLVSKGQYVSKGQNIAKVGSTGNSTGPHLHFEIRYNGAKQNPLNYVKKP